MTELAWKHTPTGGSGAHHYDAAPRTPKGSDDAPRPTAPVEPEPAPAPSAPLGPAGSPAPAAPAPAAGELPAPARGPSLEGVDSVTLASIIGSYVRQVYGDLRQAHREAFGALHEPPPPAPEDRPFALAVLEQLVSALTAYATGALTTLVTRAVEGRLGVGARSGLVKALTAGMGAGARAITRPVRPARPGPGAPEWARTNPAATTLLAEFESLQEESLREQEGRAERRLMAAGSAMRKADPAALRPLAEGLSRVAASPSLRAEYVHRVCTGWLQLCSAISLGPRDPGQPSMPGANLSGGAPAGEWRRAHAGFLEIEVELPDELDGLAGVVVGQITLAGGPGAARLLRQSGRSLAELEVYRRLWLGTHGLDRAPDVVIAPDHEIEVNASSSILAAIGARTRGRLCDLAAQGPGEEHERARLLARRAPASAAGAAAPPPPASPPEPGPLGPLLSAHPPRSPDERAAMDDARLVVLERRRQLRAVAAFDGASELWTWIGTTSSARIA